MNRISMCALTLVLTAGCAQLKGSTVEGYGGQTRLEHAAGAHETAEGVRLVTPAADYGDFSARGVIGVGLQSGSNAFQGVQLDARRVVADLGVRLGRPVGPVEVYLGLGAQPERLSVRDTVGEADHAWALAGYGALGITLPLGKHGTLGLEYRATTGARFDLLDSPGVDMDDRTLALSLGWKL